MAIYCSNGPETSPFRVREGSCVSGRGNAYTSAYGGEGGGVNECDCVGDYVDVNANGYARPRCHPHHAHGYERSPNHDQPTVPLPTPRQGRTGHPGVMTDCQRIDCHQCHELHRSPPRN